MTPVVPTQLHEGAKLVMIAEPQDEYVTLPASVSPDGLVMTEWAPSDADMVHLMMGGRVRLWQHTFGQMFQPSKLEISAPETETRIES